MSCPFCLENYTATLRAKVSCPYCPSATCKPCTQRYLLSSYDDPHCHSCRRGWSREFIDMNLTKAFRNGDLRKHRAKILMEREKALLPSHQIFVEATKEMQAVSDLRINMGKKWSENNIAKNTLLTSRLVAARLRRAAVAAGNAEEVARLTDTLVKNAAEYGSLQSVSVMFEIDSQDLTLRNDQAYAILQGRAKEAAREFIQRCPGEDCRGYLSTSYKCGTCAKYTCNECLVVKGESRDSPHTCDEDAKASASLIRRETKPCPKCGVRIYKIDGCDQMFCTQETCHTAFSWNTGHVVTGIIHNPHYYDWLRSQNGGVVPREAGDIPCGGLPAYGMFFRVIHNSIPPIHRPDQALIYEIHRCFSDIIHAHLPDYPARRPANMNRDTNIRYLMNQISVEVWQKSLEALETKFERKKEIGQILSTFAQVGSEYMRSLENAGTANVANLWFTTVKQQLEELRLYTNKSLVDLGKRMICAIPQINSKWAYIHPRKEGIVEVVAAPAPAAAPVI